MTRRSNPLGSLFRASYRLARAEGGPAMSALRRAGLGLALAGCLLGGGIASASAQPTQWWIDHYMGGACVPLRNVTFPHHSTPADFAGEFESLGFAVRQLPLPTKPDARIAFNVLDRTNGWSVFLMLFSNLADCRAAVAPGGGDQ
jgi:hypothetical protein